MRTIGTRIKRASIDGFVGRESEQQRFRTTLRQLAALRDTPDDAIDDEYAQIFLVVAEGGGLGHMTLVIPGKIFLPSAARPKAVRSSLE